MNLHVAAKKRYIGISIGMAFMLVWCTYVRPSAGEGVTSEMVDGTPVATVPVPARIQAIFDRLMLPPGFAIEVFAQVPNARSLAVAYDDVRNKQVIFVGNKDKWSVYALIDEWANNSVEVVKEIAKGRNMPNGVAFKDGNLYLAEMSKIHIFPDILTILANTGIALEDIPSTVVLDTLPKDKQHGRKYIAFWPDGELYIPVGAPCNICNKPAPYSSIMKMNVETKQTEIVANWIRNTVGFARHPDTQQLWFTDNWRDNLGDARPPDELNVVTKEKENFGFPFCYGSGVQDPVFPWKDCQQFTAPQAILGAHVAALGMKFYTWNMFPENYQKKIFIAEHGSRNSSTPVGYRISLVDVEKKTYEVFAQWRLSDWKTWWRPVDVLELRDWSLLVSDDYAGVVYRITYAPQ